MDKNRRLVLGSAKRWQQVEETRAAIDGAELPRVDTARSLAYLAPAFRHAAAVKAPKPSSGLVEQQQWFARWHERHAVH